MADNTDNIDLYKKNPVTDGTDTFNIETMLNENWDKIDETFDGSIGHKHTGAVGDAPKITSSSLVDGAATDAVIGNRTIDDTIAAAAGADTPTRLWSKLGNIVKQITGKSAWPIVPAITLETISTYLNQGVKTTDSPTFTGTTITGTLRAGTKFILPVRISDPVAPEVGESWFRSDL